MWKIIALATLMAVAIIVLKALRHKLEKEPKVYPYYEKRVMSQPEMVLYYRLVEALPDQIILSQVQLSRFLGVKKGFSFHEWNNRINRMSADFIVCNKDSSIRAVIELDDSTHTRADRIKCDLKKNKAIASAGIRLVRWNVTNMPSKENIKATVLYGNEPKGVYK